MKNCLLKLLLLILPYSLHGQTWKFLGNNAEVSGIAVGWVDMAIDKSTDDVYIVHPGYDIIDSTNIKTAFNIHKHSSDGWTTLPNPPNLGQLHMPLYNNGSLLKPRVVYANDALYFFYCFSELTDKIKIKKFKNNQWTNVGDTVNGYAMETFFIYDVLAHNNSIYIYKNNVLFKIDQSDVISQYTIPFATAHPGAAMVEHNGEIYIHGKPNYSYEQSNQIEIFKFNPSTENVESYFATNNLGTPGSADVELVVYNNKINLIVAQKNGNEYNILSTDVSHFEITNNNQVNLTQSYTIQNFHFSYCRIRTAENYLVAIASKKDFGISALIYDGSSWSPYGNYNEQLSPMAYPYQLFFDSQNRPYVAGEMRSTTNAAVVYLEQSVSIEETKTTSLTVFPNPSNGIYQVNSSEIMENANYQVYALDGKLIEQKNATTAPFLVDIQRFSDGIYLLKVNQGGKSTIEKLIKKTD